MPFKDKVKQLEAQRRHYARNAEKIKPKVRETNRRLRARNREYVNNIKSNNPCVDCGLSYPPYVMQFDHVLEGKRAHVATMVKQCLSLKTIQTEIDKCEIVCANCHAERTYGFKEELEEDFPHEA